jgi:hypothetical protein
MRNLRTILGAAVLLGLLTSMTGCLGTMGLDDLYVDGGLLGPQLDVSPQLEVTFPEAPAGAYSETEVMITSAGDVPVALETVNIVGDDANMFAVNDLPLPLMLPVGGQMPVRVFFEPQAEGQFRAALEITTRNQSATTEVLDVIGQACRDWDEDLLCDNSGPPAQDSGWDTGL